MEKKLSSTQIDLTLSLNLSNLKNEEIAESQTMIKTYENEQKQLNEIIKLNICEIKTLKLDMKQSNNSIKELKQINENTRYLLEKTFLKLKILKDEHLELQKKNNQLVSERQSLVIRAAVSYDELTPRPNIQNIIEKFDCEYEKFGELIVKHKNKSTIEIFENLIKKFEKIERKKSNRKSKEPFFTSSEFIDDSLEKNKKEIGSKQRNTMKVRASFMVKKSDKVLDLNKNID